jgi:hypothetical protein
MGGAAVTERQAVFVAALATLAIIVGHVLAGMAG